MNNDASVTYFFKCEVWAESKIRKKVVLHQNKDSC
jgi:hypothetical protein